MGVLGCTLPVGCPVPVPYRILCRARSTTAMVTKQRPTDPKQRQVEWMGTKPRHRREQHLPGGCGAQNPFRTCKAFPSIRKQWTYLCNLACNPAITITTAVFAANGAGGKHCGSSSTHKCACSCWRIIAFSVFDLFKVQVYPSKFIDVS